MTSRIHRGFHRVGIVLAGPVLLVAGVLASREVWLALAPSQPLQTPDQATVTVLKRWGVDLGRAHSVHISDYVTSLIVLALANAL